ncbi:MAG: DUF6252 family protein [Bacteroidota bacterium]|nr:DUF6252 family protein [Bacteroidota bacterium]MDP4229262.1 DUF6252 family protein [Bacteroidota bacterium]MDP4237113.1 DUF6252 family protein [Bacteroidota bacterium]
MSYITLDELRVASPCDSPEWSEMKGGDDYSRLCMKCDKNVYNLSLMTLDEANELIRKKEGKLCITLYRRFDGTVLTSDCPVGLRAIRRQYLKTRAKAIAFALALWGFITSTTSCGSDTVVNGLPLLPPNFSADLNGKNWAKTRATGINDTVAGEIWINAIAPDSTSMWIFIDSTERAPGTYENPPGIFPAGGYNDHTSFGSNYWYSGELKITAFSLTHVTGTFHFNAKRSMPRADTVMITNGQFDVNVTYGRIPN